jgi:hypothetical protein
LPYKRGKSTESPQSVPSTRKEKLVTRNNNTNNKNTTTTTTTTPIIIIYVFIALLVKENTLSILPGNFTLSLHIEG